MPGSGTRALVREIRKCESRWEQAVCVAIIFGPMFLVAILGLIFES